MGKCNHDEKDIISIGSKSVRLDKSGKLMQNKKKDPYFMYDVNEQTKVHVYWCSNCGAYRIGVRYQRWKKPKRFAIKNGEK